MTSIFLSLTFHHLDAQLTVNETYWMCH